MPSITIKNIPGDLYDELKRVAQQNRRSLDHEVITLLAERLCLKKMSHEKLLVRARACREMTKELGIFLTPDEIESAIDEGRFEPERAMNG